MFHFSVGERLGADLNLIGLTCGGIPIRGSTRFLIGGSPFQGGLGGNSFFLKGGLAAIVFPPLLYFTLGISDQSSSILNPFGIIFGTKTFIISSSFCEQASRLEPIHGLLPSRD